jgi:heme exporter protein B
MTNNKALFKILFYRDCIINYRQGGDYLLALSFWLLVICFFPLSSNASPQLLQSFAPGIIWLGLLLTQLLNLPKFFRNDYHDGLIAELIQSPNDFFFIVLYKLFNFWLINYLPILILTPLLGLMLLLPKASLITLEFTILLGSPTLTLLSGFIASLTVSLKNSTLLANLLFLPLTTPILIFATGAINNTLLHTANQAPLAWLGVMLLISLILFPWAICTVLKAN